jgi:hypothetical protein
MRHLLEFVTEKSELENSEALEEKIENKWKILAAEWEEMEKPRVEKVTVLFVLESRERK